jgi:hypothetical protein
VRRLPERELVALAVCARFDTAPNRPVARHWRMPTFEVISLILVVVVWIVLLRSFSVDP